MQTILFKIVSLKVYNFDDVCTFFPNCDAKDSCEITIIHN